MDTAFRQQRAAGHRRAGDGVDIRLRRERRALGRQHRHAVLADPRQREREAQPGQPAVLDEARRSPNTNNAASAALSHASSASLPSGEAASATASNLSAIVPRPAGVSRGGSALGSSSVNPRPRIRRARGDEAQRPPGHAQQPAAGPIVGPASTARRRRQQVRGKRLVADFGIVPPLAQVVEDHLAAARDVEHVVLAEHQVRRGLDRPRCPPPSLISTEPGAKPLASMRLASASHHAKPPSLSATGEGWVISSRAKVSSSASAGAACSLASRSCPLASASARCAATRAPVAPGRSRNRRPRRRGGTAGRSHPWRGGLKSLGHQHSSGTTGTAIPPLPSPSPAGGRLDEALEPIPTESIASSGSCQLSSRISPRPVPSSSTGCHARR